jgi:hypothetical protein
LSVCLPRCQSSVSLHRCPTQQPRFRLLPHTHQPRSQQAVFLRLILRLGPLPPPPLHGWRVWLHLHTRGGSLLHHGACLHLPLMWLHLPGTCTPLPLQWNLHPWLCLPLPQLPSHLPRLPRWKNSPPDS